MTNLPYNLSEREKAKMHSDRRAFVLKVMEGKHPVGADGTLDKRLFTGENQLLAIKDINKGMWFLRYTKQSVPGALSGMFTDFNGLVDYVKAYFARRNVEVIEVQS